MWINEIAAEREVRRDNHQMMLQMMRSLCLVLRRAAFTRRAKKLTRVKSRNLETKMNYRGVPARALSTL